MIVTCPCCDTRINTDAKKQRSLPQHRRFFALIRQALFHWPELSALQFSNEKALRKYLTMKAGWREISSRTPIGSMPENMVIGIAKAAILGAGSHAVPIVYKGELVIFVPRSIAFDKLEHAEACKLFDAVAVVIEQETGLRAEELLQGESTRDTTIDAGSNESAA